MAAADSMAVSSHNVRDLLSPSYTYGLTERTEKASEINQAAESPAAHQPDPRCPTRGRLAVRGITRRDPRDGSIVDDEDGLVVFYLGHSRCLKTLRGGDHDPVSLSDESTRVPSGGRASNQAGHGSASRPGSAEGLRSAPSGWRSSRAGSARPSAPPRCPARRTLTTCRTTFRLNGFSRIGSVVPLRKSTCSGAVPVMKTTRGRVVVNRVGKWWRVRKAS